MYDSGATLVAPYSTRRLIGGRYELYGEIGRGGFGIVYEAFDARLLRHVALKLPRPGKFSAKSLRYFAREIECAARVQHRNVCRVLDAGVLDDGRPFVVMERLQGETLFAFLARRKTWGASAAIDIALDVLAGLEAIHAQGIVHRDVKPGNVFLAERPGGDRPIVKLLDFGSCRDRSVGAADPVSDRRCTGTPAYMTPERIRGARDLGSEGDLYAVGVLLYEMLSGRPAYEGDLRQIVHAIVRGSFPRLRAVRPELIGLDAIVARATSRDRKLRYGSVAELRRDLELARDRDDELPTLPRRH